MKYHFTFRNMPYSDSLESYARGSMMELLGKFGRTPIEGNLTFERDRYIQVVRCEVTQADGYTLRASHCSESMSESVDRMLEKLGSQLRKRKVRRKALRNDARNLRSLEVTDDILLSEADERDADAFSFPFGFPTPSSPSQRNIPNNI